MITTIRTRLTNSTQSLLLAVLLVSPLLVRGEAVPPGPSVAKKFLAGNPVVPTTQQQQPGALITGPERSSGMAFTTLARIDFTPLLAQASPEGPIEPFLGFLTKIFLIIGAIIIAFGGYEVSRGRVMEGLLSLLGGLILALAIPIIRWLIRIGAGGA